MLARSTTRFAAKSDFYVQIETSFVTHCLYSYLLQAQVPVDEKDSDDVRAACKSLLDKGQSNKQSTPDGLWWVEYKKHYPILKNGRPRALSVTTARSVEKSVLGTERCCRSQLLSEIESRH